MYYTENTAVVPDVVEFPEWAASEDTSAVWSRFYSNRIKPLQRRDFQFIFHLGDVSAKRVFDVDEVLDIMGDYSSHGSVTLVLSDLEADTLWRKLNGFDPGAILHGDESPRLVSLFNTMRIDSLVVLHDTGETKVTSKGAAFFSSRVLLNLDFKDRVHEGMIPYRDNP